ncbi:MAG: hypothetical protein M1825_006336 [Sarcosagium campestre]|nr:MAG: hypothetical protein M1825_006336 [Sarcosagium campestre]
MPSDQNDLDPSANGNDTGNVDATRSLRPGIYAPTPTFFDSESEDLDLSTIRLHSVRLAKDGLAGLVTMGSNGEAVHLDRDERIIVTRTTREALDAAGFTQMPIIVGAGEQSTRGTIAMCRDAARAGGDYVLVIPPSFFRPAMSNEALYKHYTAVADASSLPVLLYNYPAAVAGIDMDSDLLIRISRHANVVGTKFTCGNTGKLTRVAAATEASTPASQGSGYMAFGGLADFTLQTLMSGGSGIVAGGANVFPRTCVRVFKLYEQSRLNEAIALQAHLSEADGILIERGVPGMKAMLQQCHGYGGHARRPLQRIREAEIERLGSRLSRIIEVEKSLQY